MKATLMTIGLALGSSAALSTAAVAQAPVERVSMSEALQLFGENSLALRIARAEASEIEGLARQSRAYVNPALAVSREDLGLSGEEYWETVVGLEQRIEWPGRTAARSRAAGHRVGVAVAGFRADSLRLSFDVRRGYAEAWVAEERERALARAAEVIRTVATAAENRLAEGDISGYETRRLRLERARVEQEMAGAGLDAAAARRALGTLVAPQSEAGEIGPSEPLSGLPPSIPEEVALAALAGRPDLEAARRAVEAANAEVSIASTGWVPDPTLFLGFKDRADGFSGVSVGVTMSMPLFDRRAGARAGAGARRDVATAGLTLREREARNDVHAASERYRSTRRRLELGGDGLAAEAAALLEIAESAYGEGELTLVELLDAARAFREARVAAVELRADTWIAYYDLLRALGRAPEEDR